MANYPQEWTSADTALWNTLVFQQKLEAGLLVTREDWRLSDVHPTRPKLGTAGEEIMIASGGMVQYWWGAIGDGQYDEYINPVHASTIALNNKGIQLAAAGFAAEFLVNAKRMKNAQDAATPRWRQAASGTITVSTHGYYIDSLDVNGVLAVPFDNIDQIKWLGQGWLELVFDTAECPFRLNTDWAELILVLWAKRFFPDHPNRYSYFTTEWVEKARVKLGGDPFTISRPQLPELDA
ncbi:hypothetical protein ACUH9Y_07635 [Dermabacteraceae bacterium P13115]